MNKKGSLAAVFLFSTALLCAACNKESDAKKQRITVQRIQRVGAALFAWAIDNPGAGSGKGGTIKNPLPKMLPEELERMLKPKGYLKVVPRADGWGNPLEFYLRTDRLKARPIIIVRSPGKDGKFQDTPYVRGWVKPKDFDADIVWQDSTFLRRPKPAY